MSTIINRLVIFIVRLYQLVISPLFPDTCRFYPTCSHYTIKAFHTHSFPRATWLSLKRIGRCHPWHAGGYDPVPESEETGIEHG